MTALPGTSSRQCVGIMALMRPSFLALRELSFARGRFVLMGAVVGLVAVLMV